MALGRVDPDNHSEDFCMTVLALKVSRRANAVPRCTATSRAACGNACVRAAARTTCRSATSPTAFTCCRGWRRRCSNCSIAIWDPTGPQRLGDGRSGRDRAIDDGELWETHQTLKARLLDFARRRAVLQAERRGEPPEVIAQLRRALSLDTLTIGFARRFATYKRANLLPRPRRTDGRWSTIRRCRCSWCSPARPIRRTCRASKCCRRSPR